jgi:hypothetical protein
MAIAVSASWIVLMVISLLLFENHHHDFLTEECSCAQDGGQAERRRRCYFVVTWVTIKVTEGCQPEEDLPLITKALSGAPEEIRTPDPQIRSLGVSFLWSSIVVHIGQKIEIFRGIDWTALYGI